MWLDTGRCILGRPITAYIQANQLLALDLSRSPSPHAPSHDAAALMDQLCLQLDQYLAGTRQGFDLAVAIPETPWRLRVFQALADVPYGKTVSYATLAHMAGNSSAPRAVASVMASNPLLLLRACHRVVPAHGQDYGKYRWGPQAKKYLLELEARNA